MCQEARGHRAQEGSCQTGEDTDPEPDHPGVNLSSVTDRLCDFE